MNEKNETQIQRAALLEEKAQIQAEINSYPGPIAGCDQQFNHLLERRADVRKKLRELTLKSQKHPA